MIGLNLGSARKRRWLRNGAKETGRRRKGWMKEMGKKMETVECVELFEPFSQNNLSNYTRQLYNFLLSVTFTLQPPVHFSTKMPTAQRDATPESNL